jgi:hypothetical protein
MTPRNLRLALLGLCVAFAFVIAIEILYLTPGSFTPSNSAARNAAARGEIYMAPNIDALVTDILGRPLFTSSRIPAERTAKTEDNEKKPPQLQARLTGIMLRADSREALFERNGGKPIAIKVGGEIDGWKVSAIQSDQVVLTSDLGDQIVKPTGVPAAQHAALRPKPVAKKSNTAPANGPVGPIPPAPAAGPSLAPRPAVTNKTQALSAASAQSGRQGYR